MHPTNESSVPLIAVRLDELDEYIHKGDHQALQKLYYDIQKSDLLQVDWPIKDFEDYIEQNKPRVERESRIKWGMALNNALFMCTVSAINFGLWVSKHCNHDNQTSTLLCQVTSGPDFSSPIICLANFGIAKFTKTPAEKVERILYQLKALKLKSQSSEQFV